MSYLQRLIRPISRILKRKRVPHKIHEKVLEENKILKAELKAMGDRYNSLLEFVEEQNSIISTMLEKMELFSQKIDIIELKARLNKKERSDMENLDVALSKLIFKPKRKRLPGFEYYDTTKFNDNEKD